MSAGALVWKRVGKTLKRRRHAVGGEHAISINQQRPNLYRMRKWNFFAVDGVLFLGERRPATTPAARLAASGLSLPGITVCPLTDGA